MIVLMHDGDAARDRILWGMQHAGLVVEGERSGVGLVRTDEQLHERALPGAVFTEQRVDLAAFARERHVVERDDRAEALHDRAGAETIHTRERS